MSRVFVPLANGFEEIEAITVIDLLRRADIEVVTVGVEGSAATGSHGITVQCDTTIDEVSGDFDMIALPGGMPGAATLRESDAVKDWLLKMDREEKFVSAICAAPMALGAAGLLDGKRATSFPGFLNEFDDVEKTDAFVEQDGRFVTGKGPGAAMDFALKLIEVLKGADARMAVETPLQRPQ
jgi:4-methyl-5(b-hydroxyethyl)-thiazole monophosphate biosynthesis